MILLNTTWMERYEGSVGNDKEAVPMLISMARGMKYLTLKIYKVKYLYNECYIKKIMI